MPKQTEKVLVYLQQKGDWVYGLDIERETDISSGSLGAHTFRLEQGGYVISKWGEPKTAGAPRPRLFKATGKSIPVEASSHRLSPVRPSFA